MCVGVIVGLHVEPRLQIGRAKRKCSEINLSICTLGSLVHDQQRGSACKAVSSMSASHPMAEAMNHPGPEDALKVALLNGPSSWRLGPSVHVDDSGLDARGRHHVAQLSSFLNAEPYSSLMAGLMQNRNLCTRERYAVHVCKQQHPDHQAAASCAPVSLEAMKCGMKL